jgi:hypothetical protein
MLRIPYSALHFPQTANPELIGNHTLTVSWAELAWAAISVGRAELAHVTQHGEFSMFEIVYRLAILYANLYEDDHGFIRKSSAYEGLDPSEKGAISYFLGMTLTKLVANRLLNVPWLMHLDVYRDRLAPITTGDSRPDLVGQNIYQEWIVLESKGRTHGKDSVALERAKQQASELVSIGGIAPTLHVGAVTHFAGGHLGIELDDPSASDTRRIEISLKTEEFKTDYYRPFVTLVREAKDQTAKQQAGIDYRVVRAESVDAQIGLAEELAVATPGVGEIEPNQKPVDDGQVFAGLDGVLVQLGELWSAKNMRLEPQERSR